jgi:hypothetical protein
MSNMLRMDAFGRQKPGEKKTDGSDRKPVTY